MTAPARRSTAKRTPKTAPYWWFQGTTVRELYDRLGSANPDTARFEVHLEGKKMTLEVIAEGFEDANRVKPLNDSRICPPICPG